MYMETEGIGLSIIKVTLVTTIDIYKYQMYVFESNCTWSMTLSASLRTVILCFSLLLPNYKKTLLDRGKNIVKWLGQCFVPELAN